MRRNTIATVWAGGALLAVLIFLSGPDGFVAALAAVLERSWDAVADAMLSLSVQAFDALRAGALGLYAVFLVLGVLAARRGLPARRALAVVSVLVLVLTAGGRSGDGTRWLGAFALSALGASSMTRRLIRAPAVPAVW